MVDPPWDDDEWNMRAAQTAGGSEGHTLFRSWPRLVPVIVDWMG